MKTQKILLLSMFVLMVLAAGCHYGSDDEYHGYDSGYGSYRDNYRDGRAYERRREDWRDRRYGDRRDYDRRRW
jgi:hypothetical protein